VFREAANFATRGGVVAGTGWKLDHCMIENCNAGGVTLNGNNIVLNHCTAQFNGFCGIDGSGDGNAIADCTVQGNNRKGFAATSNGAGVRFWNTHHLKVVRLTSSENVGPGIWLDGKNSDYAISDSMIFGNRGLAEDAEGSGIRVEAGTGPGVVSANSIYSNTGAGILLAECQNVNVQGNWLVDNSRGVELRAAAGPENHQLKNVEIGHNRFKEWRKEAIATGLGDWVAGSVGERGIKIDEDQFDPPNGGTFVMWGDSTLAGLAEIRSGLGLEAGGSVDAIQFAHSLVNVKSIGDADRPTIAKGLLGATIGGTVTLVVNSRSELLDDDTCAVFDWDNSCVAVALPTEELRVRMRNAVPVDPVAVGMPIEVRIDEIGPHQDVRGTLVEIK
jgi:hypothetical protein